MSTKISIRLRPGRDQDLIDWFNSLGEGERSFFIRNALRKAISENKPGANFVSPNSELGQKHEIINSTVETNIGQEVSADPTVNEQKLNKLLDGF